MTDNERKDLYELMLADISGVLRRFNKLRPSITPEEAVEEIRKIVNEAEAEEADK